MWRTELIPQTKAAINQGTVYYHFSIKRSTTNVPSATNEHQICFFESHFTELKYGWVNGESGTSNTNLQWMVGGQSKWKVELKADEWHNVAYEINFSSNQVTFWHSTGSDALVKTAGPFSTSTSSNGADWYVLLIDGLCVKFLLTCHSPTGILVFSASQGKATMEAVRKTGSSRELTLRLDRSLRPSLALHRYSPVIGANHVAFLYISVVDNVITSASSVLQRRSEHLHATSKSYFHKLPDKLNEAISIPIERGQDLAPHIFVIFHRFSQGRLVEIAVSVSKSKIDRCWRDRMLEGLDAQPAYCCHLLLGQKWYIPPIHMRIFEGQLD